MHEAQLRSVSERDNKMNIHKRTLFSLVLLSIGFCAAASAAQIGLTPSTQTIAPGGTASVDVVFTGLGNGVAPALAGYDLLIGYDSAVLQPTAVIFTSRLGDVANPAEVLASTNLFFPGTVELAQVSFLDAATLFGLQGTPNPGFVVATVSFLGIGNGTSALTPSYTSLADEFGNGLTASTAGASVTVSGVSTVPEPSSWVMLVFSAGLMLIRRRRS